MPDCFCSSSPAVVHTQPPFRPSQPYLSHLTSVRHHCCAEQGLGWHQCSCYSIAKILPLLVLLVGTLLSFCVPRSTPPPQPKPSRAKPGLLWEISGVPSCCAALLHLACFKVEPLQGLDSSSPPEQPLNSSTPLLDPSVLHLCLELGFLSTLAPRRPGTRTA